MLKRNTLGKASAKSLAEAFKCGECVHYQKHAHSSKQEVCSREGIKAVGVAPSCFTPDITKIAKNADEFVQVVTLFQSFTHSERRILLGLLRSKQRSSRHPIGTKLYFRVGKDYISNYLCGFVAGYTSSGELMLLGNPNKQRGQSFVSFLDSEADDLLTHKEWIAKRNELKDNNKITDPSNTEIRQVSIKDSYVPPTIDCAPKEFLSKLERKKKKFRDSLDFMVSG